MWSFQITFKYLITMKRQRIIGTIYHLMMKWNTHFLFNSARILMVLLSILVSCWLQAHWHRYHTIQIYSLSYVFKLLILIRQMVYEIVYNWWMCRTLNIFTFNKFVFVNHRISALFANKNEDITSLLNFYKFFNEQHQLFRWDECKKKYYFELTTFFYWRRYPKALAYPNGCCSVVL